MAIKNTGYKAYTALAKVTDDENKFPLDVNNNLCSESGLPQHIKANSILDTNYVAPIYDITTCPLITPPPSPYLYEGAFGDVICVGGTVFFANDTLWILYSDMTPLSVGVFVYNDRQLTTLTSYNGFRLGTTCFTISAGQITAVTTEGDPC